MSEQYRLVVHIAAGPHEQLEGTYTTWPVPHAVAMAAVTDLSKIPVLGIWECWGQGARPAAVTVQQREPGATAWVDVARSPWFDQLDWADEPVHGQPKALV